MDKRTLLAVVLSLGILLIWNAFFVPPPAKQAPLPTASQPSSPIAESTQPVSAPPSGTPAATSSDSSQVAATVTTPAVGQDIQVETDLFRATIHTAGATLTQWELKTFTDDSGQGVRLIPSRPNALPPLSVILDDTRGELPTTAVFSADKNKIILSGSATDRLTLTYRDASGLSVTKILTFKGNDYAVGLSVQVEGAPWQLAMGSGFGLMGDATSDSSGVHIGPSLLHGTDRKSLTLKDLKEGDVKIPGDVRWIAQEDMYFVAAMKPAAGVGSARVWKRGDQIEIGYTPDKPSAEFLLFAGPKQYDILKMSGLQDIVDFGFWSFIAHPLFWFLKLLYRLTGNYGVAIILISILTRLPFIPLMSKSQASMKAMQNLNPKMQELREKHKKDPQKLQAETMKLYKEAGVNPMSGCLPMLLQIPVFFALYKVLLAAIELRQAPFIFWIQDLSKPDTLFGHIPASVPLLGNAALGILPILMGVTMWLQQTLTPNPATMDPSQAKIMKYLPVIFTFMFFNLSSGLVLYWTIGNVVGIFQQLYNNRKNGTSQAAA